MSRNSARSHDQLDFPNFMHYDVIKNVFKFNRNLGQPINANVYKLVNQFR